MMNFCEEGNYLWVDDGVYVFVLGLLVQEGLG